MNNSNDDAMANLERYVQDLIIRSHRAEQHAIHLRTLTALTFGVLITNAVIITLIAYLVVTR